MNNTGNDTDINNASIESEASSMQQNPTPEVSEVTAETAPAVESIPDVAEAPTENSTTPASIEENKEDGEKVVISTANTNSESGEDTNAPTAKKRFPFAVVLIIVILIIIALVYYFIWITPTRVFDKAINNSIDSIKEVLTGIENTENDNMSIDISAVLRTAGNKTKKVPDIAFLDRLQVNSYMDIDLKKFNVGLNLTSYVEDTNNMKYPKDIDINADYIDDSFYIKFDKKSESIKYESESGTEQKLAINYQKIEDAISVFEDTKDRILDIITEDQLYRTITTKKINDQTTLAIKVNCDLDNADIAKIYFEVFEKYVGGENDDILEKIGNVVGMDKEEIRTIIKGYLERTVQTDFVNVNLYMNLANTQLIGLDVTVENYYVEINYLNGFYYIDVKVNNDDNEEMINVEVKYDSYYGILNGRGVVETDDTYLVVEFDYTRIESENSKSMIGNTLNFRFYDDDGKLPFCTLDCKLDTKYNDKIDLLNPSDAIGMDKMSSNDTKAMLEIAEKMVYEYFFVYGKLLLNKQDKTKVSQFIEDSLKSTISTLKTGGSNLGDITQYTEKEKQDLLEKMKLLSVEEKIATVLKQDKAQLNALLDIVPMTDQLEIVNAMTSAQVLEMLDLVSEEKQLALFKKISTEKKLQLVKDMNSAQLESILNVISDKDQISLLGKMNETQLADVLTKISDDKQISIFNRMTTDEKSSLLNKMTKEQIDKMLGKISTKEQILLINAMSAKQLSSLLPKIDEEKQLSLFKEMETKQKATILGKMSKDQVQSMIGKIEISVQISIANNMSASQLTDLLSKITQTQQLAIFDKMKISEKITLLGKMNKTQIQAVITKVDINVQLTLAEEMNGDQLGSLLGKLTNTQQLAIFNKMSDAQKVTLMLKVPKTNLQSLIVDVPIDQQVALVNALVKAPAQLEVVINKLTTAQQLKVFSAMSDADKIQLLVVIPKEPLQKMLGSNAIPMDDIIKLFRGVMGAGYLNSVITKPTIEQQKAIFTNMPNADKLSLLGGISAENLQKIFDSFTNTEVGGILQLLGTQSATVQGAVIGKLTPTQQQRVQQIKAAAAAAAAGK